MLRVQMVVVLALCLCSAANGQTMNTCKYSYANSTYEGECLNGKANGRGTRSFTNGASYTGMFKNDLLEGEGTLNYSDGGRYTGQFKNEKRDGQGTIAYANGEKYVGLWKEGQRTVGTLTDKNGASKPCGDASKNCAEQQNEQSKLVLSLDSITQSAESCILNFTLTNNLNFNLRSNEIVAGILTKNNRHLNFADSNIGRMPDSLVPFKKGLNKGESITYTKKVANLNCDSIKQIERLSFLSEGSAVTDGLTQLTMMLPISTIPAIGYSWNVASFGARDREIAASAARKYQPNSGMKYTLAFVCTDPYGGTNNDIELAKTLLAQLKLENHQAYVGTITSPQVATYCQPANNQVITIGVENYSELFAKNNGIEYIWSRPNNRTTLGIIGR